MTYESPFLVLHSAAEAAYELLCAKKRLNTQEAIVWSRLEQALFGPSGDPRKRKP